MTTPAEFVAAVPRLQRRIATLKQTVPTGTLHESLTGATLFAQARQVMTDWLLNPQTSDPAQLDKGRVKGIIEHCRDENKIFMADQESLVFVNGPDEMLGWRGTPAHQQVLAALHAIADAILEVDAKAQWGFYGTAAPITGASPLENPASYEACEAMIPLFVPVLKKVTHTACSLYWGANNTWPNWLTGLWSVGMTLTAGKPMLGYVHPYYIDTPTPLPDLLWRQLLLLTRRFGISPLIWGNESTNPNAGIILDHAGSWVGVVNEIFPPTH